MRQVAIEKPWFFRSIMFFIAVAFIVGMGWGFGASTSKDYVALVDEVSISRKEYRRSYKRASRIYRNMMGDQFKEEDLQKLVINSLVDRLLWLKAAKELNLSVSSSEIMNILIEDRSFYRKGRFDPEQYRWQLSNSSPPFTPEKYESFLREDLLLEKIKATVSDGIILTAVEEAEVRSTIIDPKLSDDDRQTAEKKAIDNAIRIKKQRAIVSYLDSVRSNSTVDIQDWKL